MALAGNSTTVESLREPMRSAARLLLKVAPVLGATSVSVTSAKRSRAQQKALYANYLAGRSAYPVAPPGTSKHELGLAVDIVAKPDAAQIALGHWWQSVGGTWGGTYKDPIHFEL